jgi:hypothetical protein
MTGKKWIILGVVFAAPILLVATALAGPLAMPGRRASEGSQAALGTGFTYQGQLKKDGNPVNGPCDFQFSLHDAESEGNQVGITETKSITVTDGLFTVNLDFGDVFTGTARWLGVAVKCLGDADYDDLGLQELTAAPCAQYAFSAGALQGNAVTTTQPLADQVLKWGGSAWVPATDETDAGTGDITAVHAGSGLSGGGESGAITLSVAFSGTGEGSTVPHSDHTHPGRDITSAVPTATLALSTTQASWSGLTGVPAGLDDGDDNTTYTVGAGLIMTGTEMSVDFASVAALSHAHDLTATGAIVSFWDEHAITTTGASDWKFFTIGGESYLAVANNYDGSSYNVDSKIYRWNGSIFTETQAISTSGARGWEFFTIGEDSYLAVANDRNDASFSISSKIYRWNGSAFTETQAISTSSARDWEFFTIGSESYLAVANYRGASTRNVDSKIYRWNGSVFTETQSIPTSGARDWEFFTIDGESYLAVANYKDDGTSNIYSRIYHWNGTIFTETQTIFTQGAHDWEFFTIDGESYLAVANSDDGDRSVNSKIYRWNGSSFTHFQSIRTLGASDWEFFTIGSEHLLAMANAASKYNSTSNVDSTVHRWNGESFVQMQSIPTNGAKDWEFFTIDNEPYLAVANLRHDSTTYVTPSKLYAVSDCLWRRSGSDAYYEKGKVGVGTTTPQSVLQIEGYVQLDTLTSAPPAADCDEASERGRMMVDIANDLLYICTNSGWVAK